MRDVRKYTEKVKEKKKDNRASKDEILGKKTQETKNS